MIKLIAALGNPGAEYRESRHNAAWQLVEYLSFFNDLKWQKKYEGEFTEFSLHGNRFYFILPLTFMNRSGGSVRSAANFYKIREDEILVIHDELELEFGVVGFKQGGGLGGHNGLRSLSTSLGTRQFNRFRIGISRPAHDNITSYVLGKFTREEQKELPFLFESAANLLEEHLGADFSELDRSLKKIRVL